MTNLERLKLELSNKAYYTDNEYTIFLTYVADKGKRRLSV